jgi:iron complex transport system permease protein
MRLRETLVLTKKFTNTVLIPGLFALLIISMLLSLLIGRYDISFSDAAKVFFKMPFSGTQAISGNDEIVLRFLRLPRILLAVLSGIGLSMSGAAMQGLFRNPLVGPEILGVSSGASFGGVLAMSLGFTATAAIVPFSFLFGCGALIMAFLLSNLARQRSTLGLVLAGIVIGGLFGALTGIITYMADPESRLPGIVYWLMGSFAAADYDSVFFLSVISLICSFILIGLSWRINILSLGDTEAAALGLSINKLRYLIVATVSLFVSAQVAVSGGVGWVGLVVPHLGRMLVGPDHARLIPVSALLGGIYILAMDTLARALSAYEIPIGLMTSIIGTPVFAIFFVKLRGRGWSHD